MVMLASLAGIALAVFLLDRFDVIARSQAVLTLTRSVVASLRDPGLNDLEKEKISRSAALRLLGLGADILFRLAAAMAVPFGLLWLAAQSGLFSLDDVASFLMSWPGIALGLGLFFLVLLYRRRLAA